MLQYCISLAFFYLTHGHLRLESGGRLEESGKEVPDKNERFQTRVNNTFDSGHYWDDGYKQNRGKIQEKASKGEV